MDQSGKINRFMTLPILMGGGAVWAIAVFTRLSVGAPYTVLHKLGIWDMLPPLWFMGLVWSLLYVLVGAVIGYLLSHPQLNAQKEACLWRGCTFIVSAVVLSLVWYTLLFGKFWLLPSWICLGLSCGCAIFCALSWWQIGKASALIIGVFVLWEIMVSILQLSIIIST